MIDQRQPAASKATSIGSLAILVFVVANFVCQQPSKGTAPGGVDGAPLSDAIGGAFEWGVDAESLAQAGAAAGAGIISYPMAFVEGVASGVTVALFKPTVCYESDTGFCHDDFKKVESGHTGVKRTWICCPERLELSSCYVALWEGTCHPDYEEVEIHDKRDSAWTVPGIDVTLGDQYSYQRVCCPPLTCYKDDHCGVNCASGYDVVEEQSIMGGGIVPDAGPGLGVAAVGAAFFGLVGAAAGHLIPGCTDICCPPKACYWSDKCFAGCAKGYKQLREKNGCEDLCCPEGVEPVNVTIGTNGAHSDSGRVIRNIAQLAVGVAAGVGAFAGGEALDAADGQVDGVIG